MPNYEGLATNDVLNFSLKYDKCRAIWPVMREIGRLPRFWVVNITATAGGSDFEDWAREQVTRRNVRLMEKRQLYVDMDPDIAEAFKQSDAVSGKYR